MKTLFLCSANVGRSQIAEGYYNYFSNSNDGYSSALIEDRIHLLIENSYEDIKINQNIIKYGGKPALLIQDIMKEDGIDISNQIIKLLTKEMCDKMDRIIILFDPNLEHNSEFEINGKNPIKFLFENYSNIIQICIIEDPFGEGVEKSRIIRDKIKSFVKTLL